MSDKISVEQLQRNNAAYAVSDFRNMVNYEKGTNKGYVRFSLGQDGKLKLEKFNNKVDVPLSWRSNTNPAHNRSMREKFAAALANDLKYASVGTSIRIQNMVLAPSNSEGRIDLGKALSRREVMAALNEFDKVFNSPNGRRIMLNNFFKAAMAEFGFRGDLETFKRDFMKLEKHGLDNAALEKFCEDKESPDKPQRERMVKSEMEFRAVLTQLEGLLEGAKTRVGIDNSLKDLARAALAKGDAFGLDIKNQEGGKLLSDMRSCLTKALEMRGIRDAAALEVFLDKVLQFYVQDGVANVRDFAGADKAKEEEAIAANFDFENLVDLAEEFVKGAAEAAKSPDSVKPLTDRDYGVLQSTMELLMVTKESVDISGLVMKEISENAAVKPDEIKKLASQVLSMKKLFRSEAAVDNFAGRFVIKHFAHGAENMLKNDVTTLDKVKDFVKRQLVPALQLQYGERWANGNGRFTENGGVQQFIKILTDNIQESVDELKCGKDLYEKLYSYTLPNIINLHIDNAVEQGGRMHFVGDGDLQVSCSQVTRTAMAYRDFKEKNAPSLMTKALDGFKKILSQQLKKGNITDDQFTTLLSDFNMRIKSAYNRAIDRYFEESPAPLGTGNILDDVKDRVRRMVQLFQEEKSSVIAEMSLRLNTAILAHSIGDVAGLKAKRNLMDATQAVDQFMQSVQGRNPPLDRQLAGPALRRGLEKLYFQTVDKMLKGRKVAKNPVDEKFVADVHKSFAKLAAAYLEKAEKYGRKLDDVLRKKVVDVINSLIDSDGGKTMRDHANLGKEDRKALVDSLAKDVMLSEQGRVAAFKRRFLEHPEIYGEESAETVVDREFDVDYTQQNLVKTTLRAAKERLFAVAAWADGKNEQGLTLGERLFAGEKLRLQQANPELGAAEIANIAKPQVTAVITRINDFPLLYSIGGKSGFDARVEKELTSASDAKMKAYLDFRTQFLKLAQKSLDNYSSLGKETLNKRLEMVFMEASSQSTPPDVKITLRAFDDMLSDMMKGIIDKKFASYLAYSKAYTEAFENTMPVLDEKIAARTAELKETGASDEDIEFFREKIVPVLRDSLKFEFSEKPGEWLGEAGKAKAAKFFDKIFDTMKQDIAAMRLNPANDKEFEENLSFMLENLGFEQFMDDPTTKAAVKANVTTWLKGEGVQGLMSEMRRAVMTLRVYGRGTKAAPAAAANESLNRFYGELRAAVSGIQSQILLGDFSKTQLEPAKKLFELWLEQYDLPKTEIMRNNKSVTLKQEAMEHFTERVRELQQRIATDPTVKEPLLSKEYIESFLKFINEQGTALMLLEMKDRVKALETARLTEELGEIFDDVAAKKRQDSNNVLSVIVVNKFTLGNLFDANMEIIEKEMRSETLTLESLARWRDGIEERFAKHMCNKNAFKASCDTRVRHVRQLDNLVANSQSFVMDALRERFAGEDIVSSEKISPETKDAGVIKLVNNLMFTFLQQVSSKADAYMRSAVKLRNPLGAQKIFPTDTEGNPALSNEFRALASACVKAACETKEYATLVKKIDKELGIRRK